MRADVYDTLEYHDMFPTIRAVSPAINGPVTVTAHRSYFLDYLTRSTPPETAARRIQGPLSSMPSATRMCLHTTPSMTCVRMSLTAPLLHEMWQKGRVFGGNCSEEACSMSWSSQISRVSLLAEHPPFEEHAVWLRVEMCSLSLPITTEAESWRVLPPLVW